MYFMDDKKINSEYKHYMNEIHIPEKKYSIGKKFDAVAFNKDFDTITKQQEEDYIRIEKNKLDVINQSYSQPIKHYPNIQEILRNYPSRIKNIIINKSISNDDYLYIGLTLIAVGLVGFLVDY